MGNGIIKKVIEKSGNEGLLNILTKKLSLSELNSLLMEVYKQRCEDITPADLMKSYELNKYVKPAYEDPVKMRKIELEILKTAEALHFTPVELSPVAPLGACSGVGTVSQNKILSALRSTEVTADATNSLALHICNLKRNMSKSELSDKDNPMRFCAIHRLIRTQIFDNPRFTPHFKLFCMVTAGWDTGSVEFEKQNIIEHINIYKNILKDVACVETFKLKLFKAGTDRAAINTFSRTADHIRENIGEAIHIVEDDSRVENQYYQGIQFKIYIDLNGNEAEVGDGGFVDWSQKLLGNKKERMMISAIGLAPLLSLKKEPF
jgi:hypothetical protein